MATHFPSIANGASPPPSLPPISAVAPSSGEWKYAHYIRQPGDPIQSQRLVESPVLSKAVREHLMNQIGTLSRNETARMLWLQGRPGEGKTTGAILACLSAGFHVAVLPASMFAGDTEGASVAILNEALAEFVRWSVVHKVRVIVLIDDFDLSTANPGDASSTVNSQLLVNQFMSLADSRHLYRNIDGSNIGFICTVNDATGMRESLTRLGRAMWHTHRPTAEDRTNIAWALLDPKTSDERDLVAKLVKKNIRQPVTFWTSLVHRMRALHADHLIVRGMPSKADVDTNYGTRLPLIPDIAWKASNELRTSRAQKFLKIRRWGRR